MSLLYFGIHQQHKVCQEQKSPCSLAASIFRPCSITVWSPPSLSVFFCHCTPMPGHAAVLAPSVDACSRQEVGCFLWRVTHSLGRPLVVVTAPKMSQVPSDGGSDGGRSTVCSGSWECSNAHACIQAMVLILPHCMTAGIPQSPTGLAGGVPRKVTMEKCHCHAATC